MPQSLISRSFAFIILTLFVFSSCKKEEIPVKYSARISDASNKNRLSVGKGVLRRNKDKSTIQPNSGSCSGTLWFDFQYTWLGGTSFAGEQWKAHFMSILENSIIYTYPETQFSLSWDGQLSYTGESDLVSVLEPMVMSAAYEANFSSGVTASVTNYIQYGSGSCGTTGGGGGPSPDESPGDAMELESTDEGIDLAEILACFDKVTSNSATIYKVQISADLPNDNHPNSLIGPDKVGHAFITLTKQNGSNYMTQSFGFYPKVGFKAVLNNSVASQVQDDGGGEANASYIVTVNASQFSAMLTGAVSFSAGNYSLSSYNCTDFAVDVFNTGVPTANQVNVSDWVVTRDLVVNGNPYQTTTNYGATPSGLYKSIKGLESLNVPGASTSTHNVPASLNCD